MSIVRAAAAPVAVRHKDAKIHDKLLETYPWQMPAPKASFETNEENVIDARCSSPRQPVHTRPKSACTN